MTSASNHERSTRIARSATTAVLLEEKARENPSWAARLAELARKLRVGAAMLEVTEAGAKLKTIEERDVVERLSGRVAALEEAQRKRAASWETFWVFAVLLIAVGPMIAGILMLWGPWVVGGLAAAGYAVWQVVAWLLRRGGVWLGAAFVAYQVLGGVAVVAGIAYVGWSHFK
jgi:hypothetical protein